MGKINKIQYGNKDYSIGSENTSNPDNSGSIDVLIQGSGNAIVDAEYNNDTLTLIKGTISVNNPEEDPKEDNPSELNVTVSGSGNTLSTVSYNKNNRTLAFTKANIAPEGLELVESVHVLIYLQQDDQPETPQGGSYENGNLTLPLGGWQADLDGFDKSKNIWISHRTFMTGKETFWTKPVIYINYKDIFDKIDILVKDIFDDMLDEAKDDLNKVIEEAKEKLKEAKELLESLNPDEDERIELIRRVSEAEGAIEEFGRYINRNDATVSEVKTEWNAKKAYIDALATWINVKDGQVNTAESIIDGLNAKIKNEVSSVILDDDENSPKAAIVRTVMNALPDDPSWKTVVELKIDDKIAAAKIEITPDQIVSAITNDSGVGSAIIQSINENESEVIISADKIALNGEVIARLIGTERLVINNGASVFEPNGSGYVANGNIRWDENGKIHIGSEALEFDNDGNLVSANIVAFPVGTILMSSMAENPFNEHWELLGNHNISNQNMYAYIKMTEGDDEWFVNLKGIEFTVICNEIVIPAKGGTVTSDNISYSATDKDGENITSNVVKDNTTRSYTVNSLGTTTKEKTLLNKWAVVFTYMNKKKIEIVNIYQAKNEFLRIYTDINEWLFSSMPYWNKSRSASRGETVDLDVNFYVGNPTYRVYDAGQFGNEDVNHQTILANKYAAGFNYHSSEDYCHLEYYSNGVLNRSYFASSSVTIPDDADLGSTVHVLISGYITDPKGNITGSSNTGYISFSREIKVV